MLFFHNLGSSSNARNFESNSSIAFSTVLENRPRERDITSIVISWISRAIAERKSEWHDRHSKLNFLNLKSSF